MEFKMVGIYMRISHEDFGKRESESIDNQRKILKNFANSLGYINLKEYIDDGFSGVNFNRPALNRLLKDIGEGLVRVVISKDLSRLGRNSSMVSYLLDEYFPENNVRYFSVNDGIDTNNVANFSMVAPITNVINELYARDISNKIRSALKAKVQSGDYIGKLGVERSYEKQLRGEKGMQILLRDAHGRVQGRYQNGKYDRRPIPGKNLTLGLDADLQALGERLMEGKIGSIVAIEPSTGEVLCMVSSPSYDPRMMVGRQRSKSHLLLSQNVWKPLLNRSIMGQYPPGSTFKTTQGLTFMTEGIIHPTHTAYPCGHGFNYKGLHVGCHGHASPLPLVPALSTSCNGYFCWGLYYMIGAKTKYGSVQNAMNTWRDYMVSMGFGYKLGIDLPGEKRGLIPNAQYYDKAYKGSWNGLTIISIAIGQGEVNATPLQIANLGATIANRGWFITPHVVKKVQGEQLDTLYTKRRYTMANRTSYDYVVQGMRASATGGTCHELAKYDFMACGKTGTAQNRGHDHSVFMGFAPMDNPKIAVAVYVENGGWGATYGVPIGGLIMEQYIHGKLSEASEKRAQEFQHRHIAYGTTSR